MKGTIGKFLLAKQCKVCLDALPSRSRAQGATLLLSLFLGVVAKGGSGNCGGGGGLLPML